jgi:hypothetical protein
MPLHREFIFKALAMTKEFKGRLLPDFLLSPVHYSPEIPESQ